MSRKKQIFTIACAVGLVLTLVIGTTLAYFWDKKEVVNRFTAAGPGTDTGVDIKVDEPEWEKDPNSGKDILPGQIIPKDPRVTNLNGPAFVRMVITICNKGSTTPITDASRAQKIYNMICYSASTITNKMKAADLAAITYTSSPSRVNPEFTYDSAKSTTGVYYFNYTANGGILPKGGQKYLFTNVVIPYDYVQADITALGDFDILVRAEAIQSATFKNVTEAMTALDAQLKNP